MKFDSSNRPLLPWFSQVWPWQAWASQSPRPGTGTSPGHGQLSSSHRKGLPPRPSPHAQDPRSRPNF